MSITSEAAASLVAASLVAVSPRPGFLGGDGTCACAWSRLRGRSRCRVGGKSRTSPGGRRAGPQAHPTTQHPSLEGGWLRGTRRSVRSCETRRRSTSRAPACRSSGAGTGTRAGACAQLVWSDTSALLTAFTPCVCRNASWGIRHRFKTGSRTNQAQRTATSGKT